MRHHHGEVDDRQRRPGDGDPRARQPAPMGERVPDPQSCDDERYLLLGQRCEAEERQRCDQALFVEVPERVEQERARERDGMELVQGEPLHGCVEQIGQRKERGHPLRAEVLAREPVDGQRTERDHDRLDDKQHRGAGPEPPQRREGGKQRIDVRPQAVDLVAVQLGDVERAPVGGRPDRLHHVAEVEAARLERPVLQRRQQAEAARVHGHPRPDQCDRTTRALPGRGSRARRARRRRRVGRAG